MYRTILSSLREVAERWWSALARHPLLAIGLVAVGLAVGRLGEALIFSMVLLLGVALGSGALATWAPEWHARRRWQRYLKMQTRHLAAVWPHVAMAKGLGSQWAGVPAIGPVAHTHFGLSFRPQLRAGEVAMQVGQTTEALREATGATAVEADRFGTVNVVFADYLAGPIALPRMGIHDRAIDLGLTARGDPWRLAIAPHTLVAGCSGSGKASLVWGLVRGLAANVHFGDVQIHGIDLKGGMELRYGEALLTRCATTPDEAVQVLEDAVSRMQARAEKLAGQSRQHVRSRQSPHVIVLIDEMAALTAYLTDRALLRRANTALSILLSQGRAVGFTVFACLQDPRKEVIPARGLFLQTVGLRLRDPSETRMVLGDHAAELAQCEQIARDRPGTAYCVTADGDSPELVRAAFVDDDEIRRLTNQFHALRSWPIVVKKEAEAPEGPARRSSRNSARGRGSK